MGDRPAMASRTLAAVAGPRPGSSCMTRKPVTRSAGFSAQRNTASMSLTCAASMNLRPPNLTKGMLRRVSSISSMALWCEVRNSTACSLSAMPASRFSSTVSTTKSTWPMSSATETSAGRSPEPRVRAQVLGELLAREADDGVAGGEDRLGRAVVLLQPHDLGRGLELVSESPGCCAPWRRGSRRSPGRRRRPRSARRRPGLSPRRIEACSALVSWYSSTSTWSKRAPTSAASSGTRISSPQ